MPEASVDEYSYMLSWKDDIGPPGNRRLNPIATGPGSPERAPQTTLQVRYLAVSPHRIARVLRSRRGCSHATITALDRTEAVFSDARWILLAKTSSALRRISWAIQLNCGTTTELPNCL